MKKIRCFYGTGFFGYKREDKLTFNMGEPKMKKIDTTPFDSKRIPPKQNLFFMPLIWFLCWLLTRGYGLKIKKENMKGLKPPFLVFATHHAFMDFYVTPLALFPYRANYVSELEGFENYGEWLYRQAGCLGTRKFITDLHLVKNIRRIMQRKGILVLYPEARYANVGTFSELPPSNGKLVKMLKVPVVVLNMHGNYLQSPIWNTKARKGVKLSAQMTQIFTAEEAAEKSVEEINAKIAEYMYYDEYRWQKEKGMRITYKERAKGLHMPLYQCPVCGTEFEMKSEGSKLWCDKCKATWEMDEYGELHCNAKEDFSTKDIDFSHVPNWYEWQRTQVIEQIEKGTYHLDCRVKIEALPNAVNFIDCGEGRLCHEKEGFYLTFKEYGEETEKTMFFSSKSMFSIHTEYNYREKKGPCVTLSTADNTYFLFPMEDGFNPTKIQFATEWLYKR